jgi:hypothetical protein
MHKYLAVQNLRKSSCNRSLPCQYFVHLKDLGLAFPASFIRAPVRGGLDWNINFKLRILILNFYKAKIHEFCSFHWNSCKVWVGDHKECLERLGEKKYFLDVSWAISMFPNPLEEDALLYRLVLDTA